MNKLSFVLALSAIALAACSSASGPTFSASELQPRDGVRTYQVDCHGIFSGPNTCMKAAQHLCGDQPVRTVDAAKALRDHADPATLVFQCGAPEAAAPAPASSPAAAAPAPVEHVNLAGDALFATGLATLTPTARASLDALLARQGNTAFTRVSVTGYTDSVGGDASNLALSQRRAQAVAGYLKSHGLNAGTLAVTGRGSADPVASNATAEGRASNRRVEISLER
ncbi:OmpA family protein [Burkholderia multivorans]|uniref:OmpA family protein n=1 Tax=Burkholderia ubonensis TaxID=101571 RepID=UPI000F6E2F4D|nr:OmpA family protein [Burkholderia ubonensis]AYZ64298.1 OmpA family protein [Burkholderia multivorans]VWB77364.1 membrane protein [Burkholderia ubonensis]